MADRLSVDKAVSPTDKDVVALSNNAFSPAKLTLPFTSNVCVGLVVLIPNLTLFTSAYKNDTDCTVVAAVVLTKKLG